MKEIYVINVCKVLGIIVMMMMVKMLVIGYENPSAPIESPNVGTLMPIPSGTFTMGSPKTEMNRYPDETQHIVTLSGFFMSKYEITQEQYKEVMRSNQSYFRGNSYLPAAGENQDNRPVESVSWYDAIVFCNTLSIKEGLTPAYSIDGNTNPKDWEKVPGYKEPAWDVVCNWDANGYRLPTEAEWEYACRAGTTTAYNTGDTFSDNTAWYVGNSDSKTHEVGKKPANAYGLYDMHGNVWEWCWDWYGYGDYPSAVEENPRGAASSMFGRILRGGSWGSGVHDLRSATRRYSGPNSWFNFLGFRVLRPQA